MIEEHSGTEEKNLDYSYVEINPYEVDERLPGREKPLSDDLDLLAVYLPMANDRGAVKIAQISQSELGIVILPEVIVLDPSRASLIVCGFLRVLCPTAHLAQPAEGRKHLVS